MSTPNDTFDTTRYLTQPVRLSTTGGIALLRALAAALPEGMSPLVVRSGDRLKKLADQTQTTLGARLRDDSESANPQDRATDGEADGCWSGLRDRLEGYGKLPDAVYPRAARARELVDTVFGEGGLGFIKFRYALQYTMMDTLLGRIDREQLAADIDALAGKEFLHQIRDVHVRYGEMVQTRYQSDPDPPSLLAQVRAMGKAIVDHAAKVIGTIDEEDPQTLARARFALRPLDVYREENHRQSPSKPAPSTPTSPT